MTQSKKNLGGRPKVVWGTRECEMFKALCAQFNTEDDVCAVMGVNSDTLVRLINDHLYEDITGDKRTKKSKKIGFSDAFKRYSANGRMSLRREQYKLALKGNPTMLIWLGKQHLGQSDNPQDNVDVEDSDSFFFEAGL